MKRDTIDYGSDTIEIDGISFDVTYQYDPGCGEHERNGYILAPEPPEIFDLRITIQNASGVECDLTEMLSVWVMKRITAKIHEIEGEA